MRLVIPGAIACCTMRSWVKLASGRPMRISSAIARNSPAACLGRAREMGRCWFQRNGAWALVHWESRRKARFGSDGRDAAEKAEPTAKRGKRDVLVEAVFAAQTSGRRVRRRSPGEPAAREGMTHRRGQADREATEPEIASNRNHSGLLAFAPNLVSRPYDPKRDERSHTRVDGRNHLE